MPLYILITIGMYIHSRLVIVTPPQAKHDGTYLIEYIRNKFSLAHAPLYIDYDRHVHSRLVIVTPPQAKHDGIEYSWVYSTLEYLHRYVLRVSSIHMYIIARYVGKVGRHKSLNTKYLFYK
jgi:hypothetical protein